MTKRYYKVIGIIIDALDARIVVDQNTNDASKTLADCISTYEDQYPEITWHIYPCSCQV